MKKYILALSLFIAAFASCKKDDNNSGNFDPAEQVKKDDAAIQAYLKANPSINATKDASGLYYQVITEGTGAAPTLSNIVTVNYVGKLLDGTQFEQNTGFRTYLSGVIKGWQIGIPFAKTGGRILLIVPSGLAYGNTAPGPGIPPNSVLVFTIDLLSINN